MGVGGYMKLTVFSEYIEQNPFNIMDKKKADEFIKQRNQQVNNWRELVSTSIDKNYGGYQSMDKDYFDFGPMPRKEEDEEEDEK